MAVYMLVTEVLLVAIKYESGSLLHLFSKRQCFTEVTAWASAPALPGFRSQLCHTDHPDKLLNAVPRIPYPQSGDRITSLSVWSGSF